MICVFIKYENDERDVHHACERFELSNRKTWTHSRKVGGLEGGRGKCSSNIFGGTELKRGK